MSMAVYLMVMFDSLTLKQGYRGTFLLVSSAVVLIFKWHCCLFQVEFGKCIQLLSKLSVISLDYYVWRWHFPKCFYVPSAASSDSFGLGLGNAPLNNTVITNTQAYMSTCKYKYKHMAS